MLTSSFPYDFWPAKWLEGHGRRLSICCAYGMLAGVLINIVNSDEDNIFQWPLDKIKWIKRMNSCQYIRRRKLRSDNIASAIDAVCAYFLHSLRVPHHRQCPHARAWIYLYFCSCTVPLHR